MPDFTEVRARLEIAANYGIEGPDIRAAIAKIDALEGAARKAEWHLAARLQEMHDRRASEQECGECAEALVKLREALSPLPTVEGEGKEPAGRKEVMPHQQANRLRPHNAEPLVAATPGASPSADPFAQYEDCAASQGEGPSTSQGQSPLTLCVLCDSAGRCTHACEQWPEAEDRTPPPADVAALVEEARGFAQHLRMVHAWDEDAAFVDRLAAALQTRRAF